MLLCLVTVLTMLGSLTTFNPVQGEQIAEANFEQFRKDVTLYNNECKLDIDFFIDRQLKKEQKCSLVSFYFDVASHKKTLI